MTTPEAPKLPPSYLFVLSSTCQMYSGTGTTVFDWIRYAKTDFRFSILIDTFNSANLEITAGFCAEQKIPLHISSPLSLPGCPDSGVRSIPYHLQSNRYDIVECVSWANASTNLSVLASMPTTSKLVFTPHSQPIWTLPDHPRFFMVLPVFKKMLRSADAVFIDSQPEAALPEFSGMDASTLHVVPLGVDTTTFTDVPRPRAFQITCVCDCGESRKRMDLLLAAFSLAHRRNPALKLILAGKDSENVAIEPSIAASVIRVGYVTTAELVRLYQTSALFVLLSDWEAFGLPIAEALCCGTPVLLNELTILKDLFADLPGVSWTSNTDVVATAAKMDLLASQPHCVQGIAAAASDRFALDRTYLKKRDVILNLPRGTASL